MSGAYWDFFFNHGRSYFKYRLTSCNIQNSFGAYINSLFLFINIDSHWCYVFFKINSQFSRTWIHADPQVSLCTRLTFGSNHQLVGPFSAELIESLMWRWQFWHLNCVKCCFGKPDSCQTNLSWQLLIRSCGAILTKRKHRYSQDCECVLKPQQCWSVMN